MRATIPPDESERLEALAAYDVLDTLPERAYDDIIRLASAVCGTPVALITLIDGDRQWFKAAVGIDERETSRDIAFCAHAILHPDVLVVPDLREDERFADNPFVTGPHAFRFYAAAPLITPDGQALGTLCVVDHEPRELSAEQLDALRALANQTMAQLELRRHVRELEAAAAERREAERLGDERLARIERDQAALMELVRMGDADLGEALDRILRTDAETMGVARVSVWFLGEGGDEIVCRDLYLAEADRHESGYRVGRDENPAYFLALSEERILAAHDAETDPRTRGFAQEYLRPAGITSMLDAPIWRKGQLVGVLCHEHVGPARRWSQEEQEFASTVADMVSLALEAAERREAEEALRRAYEELETRVQERTAELAETNEALEEEIAERERTAEELRGRTHELEGIFQALPDLYFRLEADGTLLDYRAGRSQGLYVSPEEFLGRRMQDVLPPDVGARVEEALREIAATSELVCVEYELPMGEEPHDYEARLLPIPGGQVIGVVRDTTEQKRAERALQQSEEHFRRLTENGSDLIIVIGPDGVTQYVSPSVWRLTGWTPEERIGRPFTELMHPDDLPEVLRLRDAAIRHPGRTVSVELRYRSKLGAWLTLEAVGRTLLADSAAEGLVVNARDITERKLTEEALRRSEERFRALIENGSDIITLVSPDSQAVIRYLSPSVQRVLGYTPEELLGSSAWDITYPNDVVAVQAVMEDVFAHPGVPKSIEYRIRHRDGGWLTFEGIANTVCLESPAEGLVINSRDITERKQSEAALRRSEEHFRALIENASDVTVVMDRTGMMTYQSPSVERILGYSPEELTGVSGFDYVHPDDIPHLSEALRRVTAHPGTTGSAQYRFRQRDGSWRYLEAFGRTLSPTTDAEGVVVNARDITERKQAEEELRLQKTLLEAQGEASIDGILVVAEDGRMLSHNRRFVEMWGIPEAIIERGSDEEAVEHVLGELRDPEAFRKRVEYLYRHPDEESRDEIALRDGKVFDRYSAPVRSSEGDRYGRIWFFRDITERKQAELALRDAKEEAERANRAKSEFLSRMSHELRTPMNSILGFAQLLAKRELPADQRKGVDHILKAGRHLLNLINEVLDIARIEADRQEFSLEPVPVENALREALTLIRPLAAQREIELDEELYGCAGRYVHADRQRLAQVLLNLFSNAVKYNRPGGSVTVTCEPSRSAAAEDPRFCIGVRDTGRGIPAERMEELFIPFTRLGADRDEVEGTGLGLALSQRLVAAMGGELRVESTPGVGSTFWIDLPLARTPVEELRETVPRAGDADRQAATPATLLYIEDNLANLTLIETILAARPELTLVPALQGRLGVELAWEHLPDLILLDLHLPDIPGEEVLRRLRSDERTRDTPVLVISADATPGQVERLKEAGADGYLTKPLDVDGFLAEVDGLLTRRGEGG